MANEKTSNRRRSISSDTSLGKLPDRIIAEKHRVSISLISTIRRQLRIKASHKHFANGHRRKIDLVTLKTKLFPMLGNFQDVTIARRFGVSRERIRQIRKQFLIPKYQMKTIITTICCVCGKFLGEKDGQGVSGISHGYCDSCRDAEIKKFREDFEREKREKEQQAVSTVFTGRTV